jgi:hypothetical protein
LKNIEAHIFSTLPASVDLDGLDDKIQAVRSARTDMAKDINVDPAKQSVYEEALKNLLDFHHDQFDKAEGYTFPLSLIKSDQALSPRGIAKIAATSHGRDRSGAQPKSVDTLADESVKNFRDKTPRINDVLASLGNDWQAQGAKEYHDELVAKLFKEYSDLGLPRPEAEFRSKVRASSMLNNQAGNPSLAQVKVSSASANAEIFVYMSDNGDGTLTPSLSEAQAKYVNDAIVKSRAFRFNKDKTTVHALGATTYLPPAVASDIGDGAAFTYFGGNGVYLYPNRVSGILGKLPDDPNFYSTDIKTEADAFNHIVVHETGHLQMYKLWGDDKNSGRAALAADMAKLNVPQDVGTYSRSSASESFAEQYAKYLLTGDASQQFLDLLSSKGLTKAQINKKWRDRFSGKSTAHSAFMGALNKFALDYGDGSSSNDPEASSDYGSRDTKYGDKIDENTHHIVFRGNSDISGKSGWDLHNEFRVNVTPWYGFGIYGDGQYISNDETTARSFGPDAVAKLGLAKDANLAAYYGDSGRKPTTAKPRSEFDMEAFYKELRTEIFPEFVRNEIDPDLSDSQIDALVRSIMGSVGLGGNDTMPQKVAAILAGWAGFDGLEIMRDRSESYYVVLNRGIVQMLLPKGYTS